MLLKFILRRLLYLIPLLFGVSVFIFLLLRFNGTDAVLSYLTASGIYPSAEAMEDARVMLGLDKPLLTQYFVWIKKAATLNFGTSYITKRDVFSDMMYYLPATLKLSGFALILTLVISIPLGMLSAIYQNSFIDYVNRFIAFLGVCTPNFWLGLLLVVMFSVKLKLLPPFGIGGVEYMVMPAFAISFMSIAINSRLIRTNMLECKKERHIVYAKIRGVSAIGRNFKHIFINSLIPIVTAVGMHIGELVGGALIVENIFAYPGVGRYAVAAISNNDYPVVQCFIIMMTFLFILLNLIIDIMYAVIDPRIRHGMEHS